MPAWFHREGSWGDYIRLSVGLWCVEGLQGDYIPPAGIKLQTIWWIIHKMHHHNTCIHDRLSAREYQHLTVCSITPSWFYPIRVAGNTTLISTLILILMMVAGGLYPLSTKCRALWCVEGLSSLHTGGLQGNKNSQALQCIEYCLTVIWRRRKKRRWHCLLNITGTLCCLTVEEVLSAQANILYPHSNFMAMGSDHFNVYTVQPTELNSLRSGMCPSLVLGDQLLPCLLGGQLLVQLGTTQLGGQLVARVY